MKVSMPEGGLREQRRGGSPPLEVFPRTVRRARARANMDSVKKAIVQYHTEVCILSGQ